MDSKNYDILNSLNPDLISIKDFEMMLSRIRERINFNEDVNDVLEEYSNIPYYFKKEGKYLDNSSMMPSIKDAASFYVLINYLISNQRENFDRHDYYNRFFQNKWDNVKEFIYSSAKQKDTELFKEINVDVVKGSIYKIKKYFLENNKIKDIRGASTILDYLNIDATLSYLENNYILECAIYCGGGNVLIIVPNGEGKRVSMELEKLYTEVSLTAKNAFEYLTCSLRDLNLKYYDTLRILNDKLEERKKIKIYDINPDIPLDNICIKGQKIDFTYIQADDKPQVCTLCSIRDAKYKLKSPEGVIHVCPSCLRKNTVGQKRALFYDEYEQYLSIHMKNRNKIDSLDDIKDNNGYVAVIYADGNNMGNIVKNIKTPFQQMYFSRKLDKTTKKCVYQSIYEVMGEDAKFEAIAVGGDDILLIVPANKSLIITAKIIEKFDSTFKYKLTMSAGICIAKYNTPIQNMFDISLQGMKNAKKLVRHKGLNKGTVDITVLSGNSNIDMINRESGLFPMTSARLLKVIKETEKAKKDKEIKRTQIYKLKYAAANMSPNEFNLFYLYQQARNSRKYTEYISKIFNINQGTFTGLIYVDDLKKKEQKPVSPWNNISLLWDFTGGDKDEIS